MNILLPGENVKHEPEWILPQGRTGAMKPKKVPREKSQVWVAASTISTVVRYCVLTLSYENRIQWSTEPLAIKQA